MFQRVKQLVILSAQAAIPAAFVMGWRYWPGAQSMNFINAIMLASAFISCAFIIPVALKRKDLVRFSILVSIPFAVLMIGGHPSLPGQSISLPDPVRFMGLAICMVGAGQYFLGIQAIFNHAGVPTPDNRTNIVAYPFGLIRNPLCAGGLSFVGGSLIVHPNAAQLFWTALFVFYFLCLIVLQNREWREKDAAAFETLKKAAPWRVFPRIW